MNLIKSKKLSYRYESFGGVISSEEPPFLAHVNKDFMNNLGLCDSSLWKEKSEILTAPLEVHFSVTNQCTAGCKACYTNSLPEDPNQLSSSEFKNAIDILSEMNVFHLAMGGGEALEREDFFDLVDYVREKGIIPNLTTNGLHITEEIAKKCSIFGQVNISIDGIDSIYKSVRGQDFFSKAIDALRLLKKQGTRVGINCIVTRDNFSKIPELAKFAKKEKVYDIELLRIKPVGRSVIYYEDMKLTNKQNRDFFPMVRKIVNKTGIRLKADCSFLPMIAYHKPNKKLMEQFSVYGCEAGSVLLGVNSEGEYAGCSFLSNDDSIFDLKKMWSKSKHLNQCRSKEKHLPSPCNRCDYLSICKGGCQAVSKYYSPYEIITDPECPLLPQNQEL